MKMTKHQKRARHINWVLSLTANKLLEQQLKQLKTNFTNESSEVLDATFELIDGYAESLENIKGELIKELKFLQECSCKITKRDNTQPGQHNGK